jgi:NAD(P)-dependent dehydrogenase (short-subunit alcohol dehydrogenase family)
MNARTALITGASRGLGLALAHALARLGWNLIIDARGAAVLEAAARELAVSTRVVAIAGDVTEPAHRAALAAAARSLGGLDALVNNAGVDATEWYPVHEWPVEEFDRILATNLRGPFLVSKFALPHLIAAGGGSIVHMSSVCAITVWAGDVGYDVSKAGLNMLSDQIAAEYGPQGVRSNTLMPGVIRTEMHESVMEAMNDGRAFERELLGRHPVGRFGTVEEVAEATLFLLRPDAGFLTGANVSIDGAYSRP